jgi:PqqD family protein of HPr-rel-A system
VPCETLTLIYHRPSGTTHVVAPPVPALLEALDQPMTARDLAARLGFLDEEAVELLDERLAELVEAGLVRRA